MPKKVAVVEEEVPETAVHTMKAEAISLSMAMMMKALTRVLATTSVGV